MNATKYGFLPNEKDTIINWEKSRIYAKSALMASLLPSVGTRFFKPVIFPTTSTNLFAFLPTEFIIESGMKSFNFKFAPKFSTKGDDHTS